MKIILFISHYTFYHNMMSIFYLYIDLCVKSMLNFGLALGLNNWFWECEVCEGIKMFYLYFYIG